VVLAKSGCWPRDRVTKRTIEEVKNKSGEWGRNAPGELSDDWFLDGLQTGKAPTDTDDDGIPDTWEVEHSLDPQDRRDGARLVPQGGSQADRHEGYSFLEFYLNELADGLVQHKRSERSER